MEYPTGSKKTVLLFMLLLLYYLQLWQEVLYKQVMLTKL